MTGEGGKDEKLVEWGKVMVPISAAIFMGIVATAVTGKDVVVTPGGTAVTATHWTVPLLLDFCGFCSLLGGILIRNTNSTISRIMLGAGTVFVVVSGYYLVCYYVPPQYKWMTAICTLPLVLAAALKAYSIYQRYKRRWSREEEVMRVPAMTGISIQEPPKSVPPMSPSTKFYSPAGSLSPL